VSWEYESSMKGLKFYLGSLILCDLPGVLIAEGAYRTLKDGWWWGGGERLAMYELLSAVILSETQCDIVSDHDVKFIRFHKVHTLEHSMNVVVSLLHVHLSAIIDCSHR